MTRPVLVVESDPNLEGIGRLGEAIERSGLPCARARAWVDDVGELSARDYAAIVVMGGEMHARDDERFPYLAREVELLQDAVAHDVPVLGICLGGQLLARSLGADVRAGRRARGRLAADLAGQRRDRRPRARATCEEPTGVFSWHVDIFDLPEGATQLATGDVTEQQAFRYGRAWGLQFHPEVDGDLFEGWLDAHPALEMTDEEKDRLRAEVRAGSIASAAFIERLFDGFLAQAVGHERGRGSVARSGPGGRAGCWGVAALHESGVRSRVSRWGLPSGWRAAAAVCRCHEHEPDGDRRGPGKRPVARKSLRGEFAWGGGGARGAGGGGGRGLQAGDRGRRHLLVARADPSRRLPP